MEINILTNSHLIVCSGSMLMKFVDTITQYLHPKSVLSNSKHNSYFFLFTRILSKSYEKLFYSNSSPRFEVKIGYKINYGFSFFK